MLTQLSGRSHKVYTGVALVKPAVKGGISAKQSLTKIKMGRRNYWPVSLKVPM